MKRLRVLVVLVLGYSALVLSAPSWSQARDGTASAMGEVVNVHVVEVDVRVTDEDGEPVQGLAAADFTLREDGDEVEILYFREIAPREIAPSAGAAAEGEAEETAQAAGEPPAKGPGLLVFVLDDASVDAGERRRMIGLLRDALRSHFDPADGFDPYTAAAVATVSENGFQVTGQPSGELVQLLAAVAHVEGTPSRGVQEAREADAFLREAVGEVAEIREQLRSGGITREEASRKLRRIARQVQSEAAELRQSAWNRLGALASLVEALAPMPGRKAIVYLGEGISLRPGLPVLFQIQDVLDEISGEGAGEDSREANIDSRSAALDTLSQQARTPRRGARQRKDAPPDDLVGVAALAAEARVSFYAWRPPEASGVEAEVGGVAGLALEPALLQAREEAKIASLSTLALTTGGRLARGGSLDALVGDAVASFGGYYSLAFSPDHGGDGEVHELEVEVGGRGLGVWHPESYVARPPG